MLLIFLYSTLHVWNILKQLNNCISFRTETVLKVLTSFVTRYVFFKKYCKKICLLLFIIINIIFFSKDWFLKIDLVKFSQFLWNVLHFQLIELWYFWDSILIDKLAIKKQKKMRWFFLSLCSINFTRFKS